jgi:hypothetical protein
MSSCAADSDPTGLAMETWWLIAGGVLLVAIMCGLFRPRRPRSRDLGAFSDQWLAEHRATTHDPSR